MEKGRIVQTGSHEELLATPGLYRRMYARQMGMSLDQDTADSS